MSNLPNQRMDERYPHEVLVDLCWNRHRARLVTCDVSYRGLFLCTDTPPSLRQLVRLEILLSESETLSLHAMAVHVVPPGDPKGRLAGVGVQFYAVDRASASRWANTETSPLSRDSHAARSRSTPASTSGSGEAGTLRV